MMSNAISLSLQWLGTGEMGAGFSILEGYSEDGNQDVHASSSNLGNAQAHQMVSVVNLFVLKGCHSG